MDTRTLPALLVLAAAPAAQDDAPPNFADHVEPMLTETCLSCHKGSRAKNGLELRSVGAILTGGSSGPSIVPGDASQSRLYQLAAGLAEPRMPPRGDGLTEEQLAVLAAWIDGGAIEVEGGPPAGGAARAVEASYVPPPPPSGAAVMPEGVATQPVWWTERGTAVTALATAPIAPLVAVAGHRQVSLVELPSGDVRGVLPFPEGVVHDLRFSPSGALLVAAGGRGAASGLAVGWDVRTGERVFAVGDEPDVVLSADVTADHRLVALAGPDRVVRAYEAATGLLAWEVTAHTDWVTALAFSPDGVLLATADRAGGVFVWEALTGREFHALPGQGAAVTAVDWRADSNVLAVAGEDGGVRLFEMENGSQRKRWTAHGGVLDLDFLRDGRVLTSGRDGRAELYDQDGKRLERFGPFGGLATAVAGDGTHAVVGDFAGGLRTLLLDGGAEVAQLRANPRTDEERELDAARASLAALEVEVPQRAERLATAEAQRDATASAAAAAEQTYADAQGAADRAAQTAGELAAAELDARAERERLEAPLPAKAEAETVARDDLDAAAAKAASTEAALADAVTRAADAELALSNTAEGEARTAAEADLALARELLAGATAAAQLAAARHAEVRLAHVRYLAELDAWRAVAAPAVSAHDAAVASADEAAQSAQGAKAAAEAAVATVEVARTASAEAVAEVTALSSLVEQGPGELAAAQERLAAAEAAWAATRARIAESGGRVRE